VGTLGGQRLFQGIDRFAIHPVGGQNRDLAGFDIARQQIGLTQGRGLGDTGLALGHCAGFGRRQPQVLRYAPGQAQIDIGQDFVHLARPDMLALHLAQLETVRGDDVLLLVFAHAVEKQPRLGEVVAE